MAAGFFTKSLSTLLSTASRWVEFGDGTTAPTHGAIQIDPTTGLAVDIALPAQVYGAGAEGATVVGGPVVIGGKDNLGKARVAMMAPGLADSGAPDAIGVANMVMDANGVWFRQRGASTGKAFSIPAADIEGGATMSRTNSAGSNNATALKASAGKVLNVSIENVAAYPVYLKFYNKASAPTPGTDTSVWVASCVASGARDIALPVGLHFSTGIAFAIVKGIAEADNTAVLANDCIVNIGYK